MKGSFSQFKNAGIKQKKTAMFTSFRATNFRCFADVQVKGLKRLNLIVGTNNTGKTSLLEGLFLNLGGHNPSLSVLLNALRGIEKFAANAEEVWGWLFHNRRTQDPISLSAEDESGSTERLTLLLSPPAEFEAGASIQAELALHAGDTGTASSRPRALESLIRAGVELSEIRLEFQDLAGRTVKSRAFITPQGEIRVEPAKSAALRKASYQSTRARFFKENAEQFTRLRAAGRQGSIVDALRSIDSRLGGLEILALGGEPILHADMGLNQIVPLPLMGEGFNRVLSIVLAIADAAGGVVLVDEIDNGLHFSALEHLWRAVDAVSANAGVQVFATTHSRECVMAALAAVKDRAEESICVQRLQALNGQIEAVVLSQETVGYALENNLEIRK